MNKWTALLIFLLIALNSLTTLADDGKTHQTVISDARLPIAAICGDNGSEGKGMYVKIAVWENGRVVFAIDPKKWGSKLFEGRISTKRIAELKKGIAKTGIFDLKLTASVVPDASSDFIMVDFGHRQQMLFWDEVEKPFWGDNVDPTPAYLKLKACWKAVNRLMLALHPEHAQPIKGGGDVQANGGDGILQENWFLVAPH